MNEAFGGETHIKFTVDEGRPKLGTNWRFNFLRCCFGMNCLVCFTCRLRETCSYACCSMFGVLDTELLSCSKRKYIYIIISCINTRNTVMNQTPWWTWYIPRWNHIKSESEPGNPAWSSNANTSSSASNGSCLGARIWSRGPMGWLLWSFFQGCVFLVGKSPKKWRSKNSNRSMESDLQWRVL